MFDRVDRSRIPREPRWSRIPAAERESLIELIKRGSSVEAMKRFRARSGLGLADCWRAIEAVLDRPRPPSADSTGQGAAAGGELRVSPELVSWDERWQRIPAAHHAELVASIERASWAEARERFRTLSGLPDHEAQAAIEAVVTDASELSNTDGPARRIPLSPANLERLRGLFAPDSRDDAIRMVEACGADLPLVADRSPGGLERIRGAVLTVSKGDRLLLRRAVRAAHDDWRNVLWEADDEPR